MAINALAPDLVMDRTTLGRNILPLQRDGLIEASTGAMDRRRKELRVTEAGARRLDVALSEWRKAQAGFEAAFGSSRASDLRRLLRGVVATEFEETQPVIPPQMMSRPRIHYAWAVVGVTFLTLLELAKRAAAPGAVTA